MGNVWRTVWRIYILMLGRKELILLFDRLDEKSETEPIPIYFRLPLLSREWGEILSGNGLVEDTQENVCLFFLPTKIKNSD